MSSESKSNAAGKTATKAPLLWQVSAAYEALVSMQDMKFTAGANSKILRLAKWAEPWYQEFNETKLELAKKFGKPADDSEGKFVIQADKLKEFNVALVERVSDEISIPERVKLSIADFGATEVPLGLMSRITCFVSGMDD